MARGCLLVALCIELACAVRLAPAGEVQNDGWASTTENTTTTATTTLEPEKVKIGFSIAGITPQALIDNPAFKDMLTGSLQSTVAQSARVPSDWVDIRFKGVMSVTATTHLKRSGGLDVDATITVLGGNAMGGTMTSESITSNLAEGNMANEVTARVRGAIADSPLFWALPGVNFNDISASEPAITVINIATPPADVSSYGDPHCKNLHGNRFDIQRPGNHSFLVLPRGADRGRANLHVEARVTRRGGLCTGKLFVTSFKLAGRWMRTLGGDVELYAATEMFNSPKVVGLRLGNSSNISLEEFVARVPKQKLEVLQFRPELPAKLNTHVNTLTLQFKVGPSTMKIGWAHEKLNDGFANWLWLGVSGLGTTDDAGGLLGLDDHSDVQKVPKDVLAACQATTGTESHSQDAGLAGERGAFRSWAFAEA